MIKLYPYLLLLVITSSAAFGQGQKDQFQDPYQGSKSFYRLVDSLNKLGRLYSADSNIIGKVKLLDEEHPSKYIEAIGELLKDSNLNDAAFVYYLGDLRYRYYTEVNPDYKPSDDGALLGSFESVFGGAINMYLETNIDNFVSVLKASGDYFAKNDYPFYPRAKNPAKYDTLAAKYPKLIKDLETNKEKYRKQWDEERIQIIKYIDELHSHSSIVPDHRAIPAVSAGPPACAIPARPAGSPTRILAARALYNPLIAFTTRLAISASPLSEGCSPSYVISCASGGYGYSSAGSNGTET